ncbi:MAG: helix-turn-helix transcriptional regulator [Anaerolineales bacterium]|nr:helix-turn-helix transcriptional regulator [Anaerolineales bacterium]
MSGYVTRSLLLDAAHSLFVNQGYAATSMRQIAESAGVALGGIYNRFASKEAIFHAILIERHPNQQIMPLIQKMQAESGDHLNQGTVRSLLNELGNHTKFFDLMLVEMVEFKRQAPARTI